MAFEIFRLVGSIFVDSDKANESIKKTDKNAEGLGKKFISGIGTAAKWGAGIATAAGAGAAALYKTATSAAASCDEIDKMSQKIGISKTAYQEWKYAMGQSGVDISIMQSGVKKLTDLMDNANSGNATAIDTFNRLGVSIHDSTGKMKGQEEMMQETITKLASMEDSTERAALASDLFGKSATELEPLLNSGADGIQELIDRSHELGLIMSDEAVNSGVKLGDTIDDVKQSFGAIVNKIGVEVMPIIQKGCDWVIENMPIIQTVFETVFGAIEMVVSTVGGIFDSVFSAISDQMEESGITFQDVFNKIMQIVGVVVGYFMEAMPKIKDFVGNAFGEIKIIWEDHLKPCFEAIGDFLNNVLVPIFKFVFENVIAPVVNTVFKAIGELWNNSLKPVFTNIIDFIKNIFTGNFAGAFENIINIVKGIWDGIITIVKTPINAVIGIINKFIGGLNKMKIPDWVPVVGGKGINIPEIPLLAKGGKAIAGGSAIVGEAGAELIDLPAGAKVTPLTNAQGELLGLKETIEVLKLVLAELKELNRNLYETILDALVNGVEIDWNDRNLGRLVRKYA